LIVFEDCVDNSKRNYYLINIPHHMADLTPEEIARNIEALKQKKGDARTGGKGSQRRKVKVVHKNPVL
jgi:hypothetical protein